MSLIFNEEMIDTLSSPCLSSSSTEKANWIATFRRMNKVSPTTLETQTTINGMRNTSSTRISYPQRMFIPLLTQWTQQHLVPDKLPLHLMILSLLKAHFPIKWDLISMVDIHFLWLMEQCLCIEKSFFYLLSLWFLLSVFAFNLLFFFYCFDDSNNLW